MNLFELQINFSYRNLPIFRSNWHNNISRGGWFTSTTPESVYTVNLLRERKSISRVASDHGPNWIFIGWFLNTTSHLEKNVGSPKNHLCSNVFFSKNALMHASHGNRNMKMKTFLHIWPLYYILPSTMRSKPRSVYTILPYRQDVKSCYQRTLCVVAV